VTIARYATLALKFVLELCMLAALAAALAAAKAPVLAVLFAAVVALDTVLLLRWESEERTGLGAPGG
jgi:hypothetical protein